MAFYNAASPEDKKHWQREYVRQWADPAFVAAFVDRYKYRVDAVIDDLLARNYAVIGFSIFYTTRHFSLALARLIRERDPKIKIVFGGPDTTRNTLDLIRAPEVDVVILGEGEETFFDYMERVRAGTSRTPIPGALVKDEAGAVIEGGAREPIADLDSLPFLDFSSFKLRDYTNQPIQLPVLASRGCVRKCVFCPDTVMWGRYRWMSGERLFREIEHQVAASGIRDLSFEFCDLLINGNMHTLAKFVELMRARRRNRPEGAVDLGGVTWFGQAIISHTMTRPFLEKMAEAGCVQIQYGVESGSQRVLNMMKKGYRVNVAERVLRDTASTGMRTLANFMFGFPGESEEDHKMTLEFLRRNCSAFTSVNPSESLTGISELSYIYKQPEEFGVATPIVDAERWATTDGTNDYSVRVRRYKEFCLLAQSLGVRIDVDPDKIDEVIFKRNATPAAAAPKKTSKTACVLPWISLSVDPNGDAFPCCISERTPVGSMKDATLDELRDSDAMKRLRLDMLAGKKSSACVNCYNLEKVGVQSQRERMNWAFEHHKPSAETTRADGALVKKTMPYLDIRFSNICNFKCRTCTPDLSSAWHEDARKLKTFAETPRIVRPTKDPKGLWRQLEPLLPTLEEVHFTGGEPLIMEEHYKILKYLVKRKMFHVRLSYATNFSITAFRGQDAMRAWDQFESVRVVASLDGEGPRGEYLRKGQKWADVLHNRYRMSGQCPRVRFSIHCTLSAMNALHVPDFHRGVVESGFISTPSEFLINILFQPEEQSVQILPARVKAEAKAKWDKHAAWLSALQDGAEVSDRFRAAVEYMMAKDSSHRLGDFLRTTAELDEIRGESFAETFPELAALGIRSAGGLKTA